MAASFTEKKKKKREGYKNIKKIIAVENKEKPTTQRNMK
jgi:hypothetical protein